MKIYKYQLKVIDKQVVLMPFGAEIFCVQMQNGHPTIWAAVDEMNSLTQRTIAIAGTGHELGETAKGKYIGTVQMDGGSLVWHVFDLGA